MSFSAQVIETWAGRGGGYNSQRERTYTRVFKVVVNDATAGTAALRFLPGVPKLWDVYVSAGGDFDSGSFCQDLRWSQHADDPYTWDLTASYTNKVDRPDINQVENPLLRPADISYDAVSVLVPVLKEMDTGKAVRNSANDPFDPPLEIEEYRLVINITRNQATYNALKYLTYYNAVNSDTFLKLAPGLVKCAKITGRRQYENGVFFWPTVYEFHVRIPNGEESVKPADAWKARVLDQGYHYYREGDPAQKTHCTDPIRNLPVSSPRLLDGSGLMLPPTKDDPTAGDPFFHLFKIYRSKKFKNLKLF